jgi:hypothetical protein
MQHCKTDCSLASQDAALQNGLQSSKSGCSTAKRIAVQQVRMQHCKTDCSLASQDAALQNGLQSSKPGCSTAKRIAV